MPRPAVPVTIPKDPGETSIPVPVDETDDHQLLSNGSAPLLRPPSAHVSSTISAPCEAEVPNKAQAIVRQVTASLKYVPNRFIRLSPQRCSYSKIDKSRLIVRCVPFRSAN